MSPQKLFTMMFLSPTHWLARFDDLRRQLRGACRVYARAGWRGVQWELRRRGGGRIDYVRWVRDYDTPSLVQRVALVRKAAALDGPRIAVVMPSYNPDPEWLREAIESVRAQAYPHWELCIADDASTDPRVQVLLRQYARDEARIRVALRPHNGHISASSNSALELVTAPWVALMDHDDLLSFDALYHVAECICANPGAGLIYSDEDKIDASGQRFDPYFKSDWNPELFLSQNMFSHLGVLRTDLVREVGGFRLGYEGSQDWDLVMRCAERIDSGQIRHIARVLYHWRVHAASTAKSMDAKPYAAVAGERALADHFRRLGIEASAEFRGFGYRVRYALPSPVPTVSLLAVGEVSSALADLVGATCLPIGELVIDAGATPGPLPSVVRRIDAAAPTGAKLAARYNAAAASASGELLLLIDGSLVPLSPDWLDELAAQALQPGVGVVGARIWAPDMTLAEGGLILGMHGAVGIAHRGLPSGREGYVGRGALTQNFSAVTASCMVVRRALFEQVGGFDTAFERLPHVDLCLRLSALGARTVWVPDASLRQRLRRVNPATDPADPVLRRECEILRQRHGVVWTCDPAYSPNLTLEREDFSYAWPPRG